MKRGEYLPDLQMALTLAERAGELSRRFNSNREAGMADLLTAKAFMEMKQVDKALEYYRRAVDILTAYGTAADKAECLILKGNSIQGGSEKMEERMACYSQAAALYHSAGNYKEEAVTRQLMADFYNDNGQQKQALDLMKEALQLYHQANFHHLQDAYNLIGLIYGYMGEEVTERRYYLLAVKTAEACKEENAPAMATLYNRLGMSYFDINDYKTAKAYYDKALNIAQLNRDTASVRTLLFNSADILTKLGQYKAADQLLTEATNRYTIREEDKYLQAVAATLFIRNDLALKNMQHARTMFNQLTAIYNDIDKSDPSLQFIKLAMAAYLQAAGQYEKTYPLLNSYKKHILYGVQFRQSALLEKLYSVSDSALGRHLQALQHNQLYKQFSDSLLGIEKSKQLQELQLQYETEKKDKDILYFRNREQAQQQLLKEERNIRYLTIGGAIILFLFLVLLYSRYRLKKRSNRQLQQQQQEINTQNELLRKLVTDKEWLLKEVHHRVKNNLQIAISLLNMQSGLLENEDAIAAIRNSQRRMFTMSLLHQRLYQTNDFGNIDMKWYIRELVDFLEDSFSTKDRISLITDCDAVYLDVVQAIPIGLILNEAISNAIKYAFGDRPKGSIWISFKTEEHDACLLCVTDNGAGIAPTAMDTDSLGMSLMRGLADQIEGFFNLKSDSEGVQIKVSFRRKTIEPSYH